MTTSTITKTFTAAALDNELGRRKNNKERRRNGEEPKKAKSYVLPALSKEDIASIKAGVPVTVDFKSGRTEIVGLA